MHSEWLFGRTLNPTKNIRGPLVINFTKEYELGIVVWLDFESDWKHSGSLVINFTKDYELGIDVWSDFESDWHIDTRCL